MRACFQCLLYPSEEEWSHCYRKTPLQRFMNFELTVNETNGDVGFAIFTLYLQRILGLGILEKNERGVLFLVMNTYSLRW